MAAMGVRLLKFMLGKAALAGLAAAAAIPTGAGAARNIMMKIMFRLSLGRNSGFSALTFWRRHMPNRVASNAN
jgi:hypothetical protein